MNEKLNFYIHRIKEFDILRYFLCEDKITEGIICKEKDLNHPVLLQGSEGCGSIHEKLF